MNTICIRLSHTYKVFIELISNNSFISYSYNTIFARYRFICSSFRYNCICGFARISNGTVVSVKALFLQRECFVS